MGTSTLFLVVSTKQNIANLPPIIEIGNKGDSILWIESTEAYKGNWKRSASIVLVKRGFFIESKECKTSNIANPDSLKNDTISVLETVYTHKFDKLVIVANGGLKFTPIGLMWAANKISNNNWSFLYGDFRKCEYLVQGPLPNDKWKFQSNKYEINPIRLEEIIECRGYSFNATKAKRIWSCKLDREYNYANNKYPKTISELNKLHKAHYINNLIKKSNYTPFPYLSFEIYENSPENASHHTLWNSWKKKTLTLCYVEQPEEKEIYDYTKLCINILHLNLKLIEAKFAMFEDKVFSILSNSIRIIKTDGKEKYLRSVYKQLKKGFSLLILNNLKQELGFIPPALNIGAPFEEAVAERLLIWLETSKKKQDISEIWTGVIVEENKITSAEFDILIVKKNGIVIHLECKAAKTTQKELDARLANLERSMAFLSKMFIVAPLYTDLSDEDWFNENYEAFNKISNYPTIWFTLPNQPKSFYLHGDKINVPYFEENLNKLI